MISTTSITQSNQFAGVSTPINNINNNNNKDFSNFMRTDFVQKNANIQQIPQYFDKDEKTCNAD